MLSVVISDVEVCQSDVGLAELSSLHTSVFLILKKKKSA